MAKKLEQRQEQQLKQKSAGVPEDLISDYLRKKVVLELEEIDRHVCSGNLTAYDGRFARLDNFTQHNSYISQAVEICSDTNHPRNLLNPQSIDYKMPSRIINIESIASIQLFDDVCIKQEDKGESQ